MPFMMMWTPYHFWNAIFAWQKNIADLMNCWQVKPREQKATVADSQTSPIVAPGNLAVDVSEIAAEAKERPTEQSPAELAKPLPPLAPSSKKSKKSKSKKNGSAKVATVRGRHGSGARA